jgi:hypothetical protein
MNVESNRIKITLISVLLVILLYTLYVKSLPKPLPELVDVPFHVERKKDGIKEVSGVPLIIYQSWRTNKVSVKMREAINKTLEMNPEFEYYLYSDEKCIEFIRENFKPDVLNAFTTLKPGAYKSDLWRYCILYVNGGVYFDIKYYTVVPLLNIVRDNPTIYVQGLPSICYSTSVFLREAYNGFMVSPPKNVVYKDCIDDIVHSCKLKMYKATSLDITGPCLLLSMLKKYKSDEELRGGQFTYYPSIWWNWIGTIYYKGTVIITSYPEYRSEQTSSRKNYYAAMWLKGDVYK